MCGLEYGISLGYFPLTMISVIKVFFLPCKKLLVNAEFGVLNTCGAGLTWWSPHGSGTTQVELSLLCSRHRELLEDRSPLCYHYKGAGHAWSTTLSPLAQKAFPDFSKTGCSKAGHVTTSLFITHFLKCSKTPSNLFCTKQGILITQKNTHSSSTQSSKSAQHCTWAYLGAVMALGNHASFQGNGTSLAPLAKGKRLLAGLIQLFQRITKLSSPWSDFGYETVKVSRLFPLNTQTSISLPNIPSTNQKYQPKNDAKKRRTGRVTTAKGFFHHKPVARTCKTRNHETVSTDESKPEAWKFPKYLLKHKKKASSQVMK